MKIEKVDGCMGDREKMKERKKDNKTGRESVCIFDSVEGDRDRDRDRDTENEIDEESVSEMGSLLGKSNFSVEQQAKCLPLLIGPSS